MESAMLGRKVFGEKIWVCASDLGTTFSIWVRDNKLGRVSTKVEAGLSI
jgi:hypothetical protein